jgi:hypothetical protein
VSEWAYYLEPDYYETVVTGFCLRCEADKDDVDAKVQEYKSTAYWQCPDCQEYNETEI